AKRANGTACTDDGNPCTTDACDGTHVTCQHAAGNPGAICRAAANECDLQETCTGSSPSCPTDLVKAAGTACTDDGNVCTTDACNGIAPACVHNPGNAGTVCRAAAGACDVAETCTGSNTSCPPDLFRSSSTACRAADGGGDRAGTCPGAATTRVTGRVGAPGCLHDAGTAGTVCRAAAGSCDVAETCTGGSTACPADDFKSAATECRPAAGDCDIAETCTGTTATCPSDTF